MKNNPKNKKTTFKHKHLSKKTKINKYRLNINKKVSLTY